MLFNYSTKFLAPIPERNQKNNITAELIPVLTKAWEQYQDDEGWANVASAGSFLKRATPDFDPRTYGATKLTEIIAKLSSIFEMKKYKGKGTANIVVYKPKQSA